MYKFGDHRTRAFMLVVSLMVILEPRNKVLLISAAHRGLLSYLLRAGAGLTHRVCTQGERCLIDFVVERERGSDGVVSSFCSSALWVQTCRETSKNIHAMKLQHTADA